MARTDTLPTGDAIAERAAAGFASAPRDVDDGDGDDDDDAGGDDRKRESDRRREDGGRRATSRRSGDGWNEADGADRNDVACSRPMIPVVGLILCLLLMLLILC
jgi:hypothetical protein